MIVGVPKEVKDDEYRVAITPAGVRELTSAGHTVLRREGGRAGLVHPRRRLRGHRGQDRRRPRRRLGRVRHGPRGEGADRRGVPAARAAERAGPVHLSPSGRVAASAPRRWSPAGNTAIAYETVRLPDNSLPLLTPMSEVAGRMAPLMGAHHLMSPGGGRGVLVCGVPGVRCAKVVILGAGCGRHGRGHLGRRDARRGLHPRPQPRAPPPGRPPLPRRPRDGGLEHPRHRGVLHRRRHRHRRRPGGRGQGPKAGLRRAGGPDAGRVGAGRHLGGPGRVLRVDPADHALRSHLRGQRLAVLLRGQHARVPFPTPRPMPWSTPPCPTYSRSPTAVGETRCDAMPPWPRGSTWSRARSSTGRWPTPTA